MDSADEQSESPGAGPSKPRLGMSHLSAKAKLTTRLFER
jgi:hypothetical protein